MINTVDDIIITALDAVHWAANAWNNVTGSTISKTFQIAGFVNPNNQPTAGVTNNDNDNLTEIISDDALTALQDLDRLLNHVTIGDQRLSANDFIEIDSDIATFNESNDVDENLVIISEISNNKNDHNFSDDEDETPSEAPPKIFEAMDMVRRLHIFAAIKQPQLHHLISQLDFQLTQVFLNSKGVKQTKLHDYFQKKI